MFKLKLFTIKFKIMKKIKVLLESLKEGTRELWNLPDKRLSVIVIAVVIIPALVSFYFPPIIFISVFIFIGWAIWGNKDKISGRVLTAAIWWFDIIIYFLCILKIIVKIIGIINL